MNDCILYAKIGNESEVEFMDITGLDAALSTVSSYDIGSSTSPVTLQEDIGVAMLGKSLDMRSEERRVGKECRSRWSPYH